MLEKEKGMLREVISLLRYFIKNRMEVAPVGEHGARYDGGRHVLAEWNNQIVVHLPQLVLTIISNGGPQAGMNSSPQCALQETECQTSPLPAEAITPTLLTSLTFVNSLGGSDCVCVCVCKEVILIFFSFSIVSDNGNAPDDNILLA